MPSDGFKGGSVIVKTSFIPKITDPKNVSIIQVHATTLTPLQMKLGKLEIFEGRGVNRESTVNENNQAFKKPFTF